MGIRKQAREEGIKMLYLFKIISGIVEVEAETAEAAEKMLDLLISPIAGTGSIRYVGPKTEER